MKIDFDKLMENYSVELTEFRYAVMKDLEEKDKIIDPASLALQMERLFVYHKVTQQPKKRNGRK